VSTSWVGRLRPRRRAGWIWALLTLGIVVNGLRLRDRLARIPALAPEPGGDGGGDGDAQPERFALVTAAGVTVDDDTLRAATAHARREGLDVLDLVPVALGTEALLDVARIVDTTSYRSSPLVPGRGARHALVVEPGLLERAQLDRTEGLDEVEMVLATARLKQFAPRATDLVAAPGVVPVTEPAEHRLAVLRAMAGQAATSAAALPIAQYGLIAAGALVSPGWATAAALAATVQPHVATSGTAFAPPDLRSGAVLGRTVALPRRALAALRSRWEPAVVVAADPRAVEERRPTYQALFAEGTDRFLEAPVDRCPWCGSISIAPLLTTPDLSQHKPGRFTLDRCDSCDHVFQNPRLTPEGLDAYYRDFYDGLGTDSLDLAFSTVEPSYRGRVHMVAEAMPAPDRWLDVGGGHGHFCLIAAEDLPDTSFDLIDQSDAALDAARRGWVAEAHEGAFVDLAPQFAGTYDVVSMHHYLEHTRDPRAELAAARTALAPGGLLLIEVPDPERSWARRVGPYWGPWLQPQHQHFVPIENLCAELVEQGFTVVGRERGEAHQPIDYSSFVGMLSQDLAPLPDKPWLPPSTPAQRAGRLVVLGASLPLLAAAYVADLVLSPILRDRPGGSNTYRVLARRD